MEEPVKIEFAVSMKDEEGRKRIEGLLRAKEGVQSFDIDLNKQQVVVEAVCSIAGLAKDMEETGMAVRIRGLSGTEAQNLGAAVCLMQSPQSSVKGVVRMVQLTMQSMIFEAAFSGLPPCTEKPCPRYPLRVHSSGDITDGARSTGPMYDPRGASRQDGELCAGMLGYLTPDETGAAALCVQSSLLGVSSLIGRAMVVGGRCDRVEGNCRGEDGLTVGIVARAAGLFENPKRICLCSGKSIWEEDNVA